MFRILFLKKIKQLTSHFVYAIAAAVLFGFMAGTLCNFATQLKFFVGYDDSLDVGRFFAKNLTNIDIHSHCM